MSHQHSSTEEDIDAIAARWVARRDAGLSVAEQDELERWCAESAQHAAAVARFGKTWAALARPRATGASEQFVDELSHLVRQRKRRRLAATTAALTIALVAGLTWWSIRSERGPQSAATMASRTVVFAPEREILPDGSVIEHPADAQLTVNFSDAVRRVTLHRGEAHFTVTKNPSRPFVVEAAGMEVRAVGTAFSVQLAQSHVEVLVTEGRVAVEKSAVAATANSSESQPEPLAFVDAGNRVIVETTSRAELVAPAVQPVAKQDLDDRLSWRATRVEFSGAPLGEVIEVLHRHNPGARFELGDADLARVQLSGLFRANDTETFTRMLEAGFGIRAEPRGDAIVLRKAP